MLSSRSAIQGHDAGTQITPVLGLRSIDTRVHVGKQAVQVSSTRVFAAHLLLDLREFLDFRTSKKPDINSIRQCFQQLFLNSLQE